VECVAHCDKSRRKRAMLWQRIRSRNGNRHQADSSAQAERRREVCVWGKALISRSKHTPRPETSRDRSGVANESIVAHAGLDALRPGAGMRRECMRVSLRTPGTLAAQPEGSVECLGCRRDHRVVATLSRAKTPVEEMRMLRGTKAATRVVATSRRVMFVFVSVLSCQENLCGTAEKKK